MAVDRRPANDCLNKCVRIWGAWGIQQVLCMYVGIRNEKLLLDWAFNRILLKNGSEDEFWWYSPHGRRIKVRSSRIKLSRWWEEKTLEACGAPGSTSAAEEARRRTSSHRSLFLAKWKADPPYLLNLILSGGRKEGRKERRGKFKGRDSAWHGVRVSET